MDRRGNPRCPHCARFDTVWNVQDFFLFGRHYSSAEYRHPVGMGDVPCVRPAVPLARKLAPPPRPPRARYGGLVGSLFLAGVLGVLFGFILSFILSWVLHFLGLVPENAFFAIAQWTTLASFLATAAWFVLAERRADRQFPLWQESLDRWLRLYYCCHCDGVFIPGQTQTLTPEQTRAYITTPPPAG